MAFDKKSPKNEPTEPRTGEHAQSSDDSSLKDVPSSSAQSRPNPNVRRREFTWEDILAWLGAAEVAKGESCLRQGQVERLRYLPPELTASVRGAARQPYRVSVHIFDGSFRSRCTCSLGGHCEHVAAALLKAVQSFARGKIPSEAVSPGLFAWRRDLQNLSQAVEQKRSNGKGAQTSQLFYSLRARSDRVWIRVLKGTKPESARGWTLSERVLITPPRFVEDDDLPLLRLLWETRSFHDRDLRNPDGIPLKRENPDFLGKLAATQRLIVAEHPEIFLEDGGPRPAQIVWKLLGDGTQQAEIESWPAAEALSLSPPWYLDRETGEIGPLKIALPAALAERLLTQPPISEQEAAQVAETLAKVAPDAPRPALDPGSQCRTLSGSPIGELRLKTIRVCGMKPWRNYPGRAEANIFDGAAAVFCYGEACLEADGAREYVTLEGGEIVRVRRDRAAERALIRSLSRQGSLLRVPADVLDTPESASAMEQIYGLASETDWPTFMQEGVGKLEAAGWRVVFDPRFRHHYLDIESWQAEVSEAEEGWLSLEMGIMVDGERLSLAPLLAHLFRTDPRWLDPFLLADIPPDENIILETEEGSRLRAPAERLKPVARMLIDLFDGYRNGPLRLSRWDAARLAEFQDRSRWCFRGPDDVLRLAERLNMSQGIQEVEPPEGFRLPLRDYQRQGLAWLQYLREQGLAGILADDMGLGKTAQTLAHLLKEKEAGRLDRRPALVVLPTSLVFNWKHEAECFAPTLKLLSLHGKDRKARFSGIPECDVALTTYPLLWRDSEELCRYEYHSLILDEAQTVKNFRGKGAAIVRRLNARHRLCLTGTPLENHLGELWAQFDFLLPGFLGDIRSFTRIWRNPIENQGDALRRDLLARRLRPFILRRKKDEVATELPPKTVIVRAVELVGAQRDLYEAVRVAMDEKIRAEIASRGFRRSQIVILDALLKLRQVCCDPRLVKSAAAKKVGERAKLEFLMDMLPELVAEGRRMLVFSQFTAMLDLIEAELNREKIHHVRLDGETRDRETPIQSFQRGEAPVFLISLKAGGVGLNLTMADTVIHYDPWWNPAVENQATDRAHRLGQDKPVFVYKLIVADSIEEKILTLQERKAELAAGILSEGRQDEIRFGAADIAALLEPLPGM